MPRGCFVILWGKRGAKQSVPAAGHAAPVTVDVLSSVVPYYPSVHCARRPGLVSLTAGRCHSDADFFYVGLKIS